MIEFTKYEANYREYKGYALTRTDPYGLWIVKSPKGPVPNELKGTFTNPQAAGRQVDSYLDNLEKKKK